MRKAFLERLVAGAYLAGWRIAGRLPEQTTVALSTAAADVVYRRDGLSVGRLRRNLAMVWSDATSSELEDVTRSGVRSYVRYWAEAFRLPAWPVEDLVARTRTVAEHRLREAYAAGDGVVVALPHMANWDWAGAWACSTGMPLITVAERLRPQRLYDEFVAYRSSLGMEILPLGGDGSASPDTSGIATYRRLREWAAGGGLVCLLADRDLSRSGVPVVLCGHAARMPRGPAELARSTGAVLLPATLAYDGPSMVITFHAPVAHRPGPNGVAAMMQDVADAFTVGITSAPADWHMMQRVFADVPPSPAR